eukprot:m.144604 g.144604  ORF g.144604 m.144604 type:complete len:526 (+) comp14927_c0_seq5:301-1878(+)
MKQTKRGKRGALRTSPLRNSVNDGDNAALVFSTEFISAMHVDDSEVLSNYKIITDNWRQKYNDPIQVPSSTSVRPTAKMPRKISVNYKLDKFERPSSYIKDNEPTTQKRIYDADRMDIMWLDAFRKKYSSVPLDLSKLEDILLEFERRSYEGLEAERKARLADRIELRPDIVCDVCHLLEGEPGNEMVFCDGCDICVHQMCYGIPEVPEGDWFCDPCGAGIREPSCVLCPVKGGAMKQAIKFHRNDGSSEIGEGMVKQPTITGFDPFLKASVNDYVHSLCTLWIPEIELDTQSASPISLADVPRDRYKLNCSICKSKNGACIQCQVPTCTTAFHVGCAMKEGIRMDLLLNDNGQVLHKAFCRRHENYKVEEQVLISPSRQPLPIPTDVAHVKTEFCDFVSMEEVAEMFSIKPKIFQHLFAYWVQKRRDKNGRPLMRQFARKSASAATPKKKRKNPKQESLLQLRLSLERARSLCDMVRKREVKKREMYRLMKSEFATNLHTVKAGMQVGKPKGTADMDLEWLMAP